MCTYRIQTQMVLSPTQYFIGPRQRNGTKTVFQFPEGCQTSMFVPRSGAIPDRQREPLFLHFETFQITIKPAPTVYNEYVKRIHCTRFDRRYTHDLFFATLLQQIDSKQRTDIRAVSLHSGISCTNDPFLSPTQKKLSIDTLTQVGLHTPDAKPNAV